MKATITDVYDIVEGETTYDIEVCDPRTGCLVAEGCLIVNLQAGTVVRSEAGDDILDALPDDVEGASRELAEREFLDAAIAAVRERGVRVRHPYAPKEA